MTAPVRLETAERVASALNFLLKHPQHHYKVGNTVAIFWAVRPSGCVEPLDFCNFLDSEKNPDPLEVLDFLKNIHGHAAEPPSEARFYCALLSSPKSRVTVRSWHTDTLRKVTSRSRNYFETVSLPTVWGDRKTSSLTELANATVADSSKGGPLNSTYTALFNSAFFGAEAPVPSHLLIQGMRRQAVELASGFDAKSRNDFESRLRHRTALLKLYFNLNKGISMNEKEHPNENHPAYLSGRLLAIFDTIHNKAHGRKSGSSPASRVYGSAAATPALVFPQLCKLARYHLEKIGGGMAHKLEFGVPMGKSEEPIEDDFEGLAAVVDRFRKHGILEWPRTFSLEEQGRFAIGFYYERCRKWPHYRKGQNPRGDESRDTEIDNSTEN
jgi:CRISPR-associated protein Csd1